MNRLLNKRSLLKIFIYSIICFALFSTCEHFFDFSPPDTRFVYPLNGDTVYIQAELIMEAIDKNLVNAYLSVDGYDRTAYSQDHIIDTIFISEGFHTIKLEAFDEGGNNSVEEIIVYASSVKPPTLIFPELAENFEYYSTDSIKFGWNYDDSIIEYNIQIDVHRDFKSSIDQYIDTNNYSWDVSPGGLRGHIYYWRVKASNAIGKWSGWSYVWYILL